MLKPNTSTVKTILLILILLYLANAMKVTPLRSAITSYNKKYVKDPSTHVKRYGRKSEYYAFLEGTTLFAFGNNATLHLVFNEFLHNEYRRSFIEFKYRICDFLKYDEFIGSAFSNLVPACPIPASHLKFENVTFPTEKFPNLFPFKKGRVDVFVNITDTAESIGTGFIELAFEQNEKTRDKKTKTKFKLD